jgi:hypothetical protein
MRIAAFAALGSLALSAQTISTAQIELSGGTENTLAQLWAAAAGNPKSAAARAEVSFAFLSLNRLQQAEWTARESLALDPEYSRAQLLLGWTLARQYRYTAEALDSLHRAARAYPEAHLAAADVLEHQGSLAEARAEIAAYLATGAAEHRKVAESWRKLLSAAPVVLK